MLKDQEGQEEQNINSSVNFGQSNKKASITFFRQVYDFVDLVIYWFAWLAGGFFLSQKEGKVENLKERERAMSRIVRALDWIMILLALVILSVVDWLRQRDPDEVEI